MTEAWVLCRYGEAEEMARMGLEAREWQCGAESLPVAASLAGLAAVLAATGRLADAEQLARRCLKIRFVPTCHSLGSSRGEARK